ncbi:PREDICTED: uncharacterized protein LOC105460384 [Wasmannia auropunctata]|uniref:uncharacterized protein LOC105460384 n=1 Tax=Wasmannia auropunctata TaxID=64793 RepID=UPI0005F052B7|nr:PREDICTED: uncharacterized protein LOC105460384 [Wasmannia auropunctata]
MTEYFGGQEKYFYLLLYAAYCIGMVIMVAIGTMLITYLQHTCGMFKIASYRMEHTMSVNILQNITLKNKILMTEGIICAVDIHRQAMKLTKDLMSKFEIMILCLILCGVVCLSMNLFQVQCFRFCIILFFK